MLLDLGVGLAGALALLVLLLLAASLRILREYERGVVFQLGRFWKVKGPGLVILIPGIQQMVKVGLRVMVLDIPAQDVITRDNVSVKSTPSSTSASSTPRRRSSRWRTTSPPPASSPRPRCARCSASTSSTTCWPSASA